MYWCNVKFCRVWSSIFFKSVDFFFHRLDQKNIGPNLPKLGTRDFPESDRMHISKKKFNWRKKIGRNDFFFFLNFCFDVEEIFFGSILKSLLMILQPKKKVGKWVFVKICSTSQTKVAGTTKSIEKEIFGRFCWKSLLFGSLSDPTETSWTTSKHT